MNPLRTVLSHRCGAAITAAIFFSFGALCSSPLIAKRAKIDSLNSSIETYRYKIIYAKMPVGGFIIQKQRETEPPHTTIIGHGFTRAMYDRLFHIDNIYKLRADTSFFLPLDYEKNISQKNIHDSLSIHYNHEHECATIDSGRTWLIPENTKNFLMLPFIFNPSSILNDKKEHYFFIDGEGFIAKASVTYIDNVTVRTPVGRFSCRKYSIKIIESKESEERPWKTDIITNRLSKKGTELFFWISDDERHLPVQIGYKSSPFAIQLILEEFSSKPKSAY